jgi:hypothetical protein
MYMNNLSFTLREEPGKIILSNTDGTATFDNQLEAVMTVVAMVTTQRMQPKEGRMLVEKIILSGANVSHIDADTPREIIAARLSAATYLNISLNFLRDMENGVGGKKAFLWVYNPTPTGILFIPTVAEEIMALSKEEALGYVSSLFEKGQITEEEKEALTKEIQSSILPSFNQNSHLN